jgi:hypothetical protein
MIVLGKSTFSFEDLNQDGRFYERVNKREYQTAKTKTRTIVAGSGEDLGLLGGNDGVARDEFGGDAASGLDTESKRADVDEEEFLSARLAGEDTSLDSGTVSDSVIGVGTLGRLHAAEELLEELLDLGDTSGATDEDDLEVT